MTPPYIVVKKYENRRLYDTSRSRYVNLDDIAGLIRKGRDVRIVDAKSGEDLTRSTLMQIIVEDNKGGAAGLPVELMRQLIVASDQVGRDFLMWYLKSAFDAYGRVQQSFRNGLSDLQAAATSPIDSIRHLFRIQQEDEQEGEEIAFLKKRLKELESRPKKQRKAGGSGKRVKNR